MDVYGDNREIISDGVSEIEEFMEDVLPDRDESDDCMLDVFQDMGDLFSDC